MNRSFYLSYGLRCSHVPTGIVLGVGSPETAEEIREEPLNRDALRKTGSITIPTAGNPPHTAKTN